jgi:hypothetical protein
MHLPFRRSKPLPERMLNAAAAAAGTARLALKQRTLRIRRHGPGRMARATRRG